MKSNFSLNSFATGVAVGVLVMGTWLWASTGAVLPTPSSDTRVSNTYQLSDSGAVSVRDQQPGLEAVVESVTVPPPGVWVAVRDTNGTSLGNVLGAVRVGGPRTQVSVTLLRATESGRTYAVELYRDDNNGTFDPAVNSVYVDFDSGTRVVAYFKTK